MLLKLYTESDLLEAGLHRFTVVELFRVSTQHISKLTKSWPLLRLSAHGCGNIHSRNVSTRLNPFEDRTPTFPHRRHPIVHHHSWFQTQLSYTNFPPPFRELTRKSFAPISTPVMAFNRCPKISYSLFTSPPVLSSPSRTTKYSSSVGS